VTGSCKGPITIVVFGYVILINKDLYDFLDFSVVSLVLVSIEKLYQTIKTAFDNIPKYLEAR